MVMHGIRPADRFSLGIGHPYQDVAVLLLGWTGETVYAMDRFFAHAADKHGFEVHKVTMGAALVGAPREEEEDRLNAVMDILRSKDKPGMLWIVAYSGHADVHEDSLVAMIEEEASQYHPAGIDLTALQVFAANYCRSDFLFVLECCYAGFCPTSLPRLEQDHTVEVLASSAGDEETCRLEDEEWYDWGHLRDFLLRFLEEWSDEEETTVTELFARVEPYYLDSRFDGTNDKLWTRPQYKKLCGADGATILLKNATAKQET